MSRAGEAADFVRPYFDVKWGGDTTAADALELGKTSAINVLRRRIEDIEALQFDQFRQRHVRDDVEPHHTREDQEEPTDDHRD